MADALDRVKYQGERLVVHRRGRDAAAVVPLEDLARLEAAVGELAGSPRKRPRKRSQERPKGLELDSIRRELGL